MNHQANHLNNKILRMLAQSNLTTKRNRRIHRLFIKLYTVLGLTHYADSYKSKLKRLS